MNFRPQMVVTTPIPPRPATFWIWYRPIFHCTMRMLPQLDKQLSSTAPSRSRHLERYSPDIIGGVWYFPPAPRPTIGELVGGDKEIHERKPFQHSRARAQRLRSGGARCLLISKLRSGKILAFVCKKSSSGAK